MTDDKLVHDGRVRDPEYVKNPIHLQPNNRLAMPYARLTHSEIKTEKGSSFQGHSCTTKSLQEARAALDSIYQDTHSSNATHVMYAYRITDAASDVVICGHNDDGEWSAGAQLARLLDSSGKNNTIVMVTRKYGGQDLGKLRFTLIENVAKNALGLA